MREEKNDNLHTVKRVFFRGEQIELAVPIELSDGDLSTGVDSGSEMAFLLFKIIQKQMDVLNTKIKALEPKDDKSHPFADDVMMGDEPPIKYCKICTHFNQHAVYDSSTGNVKASDYGTCYLDQHVHTVGEKACPGFCYHANA